MRDTSTRYIGPDQKRTPIPAGIEWLYQYIKGDLHCIKCGTLIDDGCFEHNTDKGYDLTEYLKPFREAHRCSIIKEHAQSNNTPVHHENEPRDVDELPKCFG